MYKIKFVPSSLLFSLLYSAEPLIVQQEWIFVLKQDDWRNHLKSQHLIFWLGRYGCFEPSILLDIYYVHNHVAYGTSPWTSSGYATKIFILQKRATRLVLDYKDVENK